MKKILDNTKGQMSSNLILMMFFLVLMFFVMPTYGPIIGVYFGYVLEPLIGFSGIYPILTLFCAGVIVITLSSLLTNFFTDWKKMGQSQETSRAFQKEMQEARRQGNDTKVKKLMKMQPEIMRKQTEASGGMMKPMVFLIIFIWPIFMWLRGFLSGMPYFYFTTPWATQVSLFSSPFIGQTWLWLYLIFSMIFGQLIRQGFKVISLSAWWSDVKGRLRPSRI